MVKVNVATLKAELSHYLEIVEGGEQVLVTSHGKEIAKIGPVPSSSVSPVNWNEFLEEHPPIKTKAKGEGAATLIRKIRDEE
jgi:prevent-host-death family protein